MDSRQSPEFFTAYSLPTDIPHKCISIWPCARSFSLATFPNNRGPQDDISGIKGNNIETSTHRLMTAKCKCDRNQNTKECQKGTIFADTKKNANNHQSGQLLSSQNAHLASS